jgi:hemerythrin
MNEYKPMIWQDSFDTGVQEIDEQHRILVNTINEAGVTLSENSNMEVLEQITNDLLSYALYHFETEEELMQEYEYTQTDADEHLAQHRSFSATVVDVKDGIRGGKPISKEDLLSFLQNWLANHILNTDKKFGAFILEKRAKANS